VIIPLSIYGLTEDDIMREMQDESIPAFDRVIHLALRTLKQPLDPKDWTVSPEKVRKRALRICRLIKRAASQTK
jgi:hypothetical protein